MNKKILRLIVLGTLISIAVPVKSVFAIANNVVKTGSKTVVVNYNNQTVIMDPTRPGNPAWQVVIPSGVNFTENTKIIKTVLTITKPNGQPLLSTDKYSVDVAVNSTNEFKLKMREGSTESVIDYELSYGEKTMSKTETEIGTLNYTNATVEGLIRVGDTAETTLIGNHSDTLVYSVTPNVTT